MARQSPAAATSPEPAPGRDAPQAAVAVALHRRSGEVAGGIVYLARSERHARRIAGIVASLAPDHQVMTFPAWDCMPLDRAPPSADVMATRIAVLRQLMRQRDCIWLLVTTPEALLQRLPPMHVWDESLLELRLESPLDLSELQRFLWRAGYVLDERVDETGEAAIRGAVVDIHPGGDQGAVRVDHADGRVTGIRSYDPLTQRTIKDVETLVLAPVSEAVLPAPDPDSDLPERPAGLEHRLADHHEALVTLLDYAPDAEVILEPGAEERGDVFLDQISDAYRMRQSERPAGGPDMRLPAGPHSLYLDGKEWSDLLRDRRTADLDSSLASVSPTPDFAGETDAAAQFRAFARERLKAGHRVILAAADRGDRAKMIRAMQLSRSDAPAEPGSWAKAREAEPGSLFFLKADLPAGFVDEAEGITVLAAPDLLGTQANGSPTGRDAEQALGLVEADLRVGDAVIHLDHGMARLAGIEELDSPGTPRANAIVLEFAGGGKLLVPADDARKIWRYGSDAGTVSLDRIGGASWPKRRAELDKDIARIAAELTARAAERLRAVAAKLAPPAADYERFAAGFGYSETRDQARAIDDVLGDLRSGRPMNRLICGDVGFGKTEVALRAAAAAVLSGMQVAVVAPTTVLVRQHVGTFRRRFAGFGIEVAHLSRLVGATEAKAVKGGLASGDTPLVIGTQALAGKGVTFKQLGLLIIDEEHRFGAKQKESLRRLGEGVHVLTLTATPIPRTMQTALLGLQDLSTIATPPMRRQPIRTLLSPFDPVTMRAALMRERRRGGQSFVVCSRVEDIEPMAARLKELVPELQTVVAHGKMPADALDRAMVDFADGIGDVLLATNIVETGLDVPRANTMLIWRADRFGLAQLHQLRGRVGRGRIRGTCYLLTDPAVTVAAGTEARLRTLTAMDRLGAGFAISARDLDMRGAGDLVGDEQAGHVKLIGMSLYRDLLERAMRVARGEAVMDWTPEIHLGLEAYVPESYVPEADVRISLLWRLAHSTDEDTDDLRAEIEDRFGPVQEPVLNLLEGSRIRALCRESGVARLDAGPAALAFTFREGAGDAPGVQEAVADPSNRFEWAGERLIRKRVGDGSDDVRDLAVASLDALRRSAAK